MKTVYNEKTATKYFSYGNINWIGLFKGENIVIPLSSKEGWILNFALNNSVKIDEQPLAADSWSLTKLPVCSKITVKGGKKSQYLFVVLDKNDCNKLKISDLKNGGFLSVKAMHCILNLIDKAFSDISYSAIWLEVYFNMLIDYLMAKYMDKSPIRYKQIQTVFYVVSTFNVNIPNHNRVNWRLPPKIQTRFFQKACFEMYGYTIQTITLHSKMGRAYNEISSQNKTPNIIARELGFKHTKNFIACFRKYFGFTPGMIISIQGNS